MNQEVINASEASQAMAAARSTMQLTRQDQHNLVLTNARVVLEDECINASVSIRNGKIDAIDHGVISIPGAIDLQGDYLLPGLVELHTDNLERHMMPRPKTTFPAHPALLAHDAEIISAGITTVFDALGVGDPYGGGFRNDNQKNVLDLIELLSAQQALRADHLLHVRCELPADNARALFEPFIGNPRMRLLSLMDHTPGQRQWTNIDHARTYYTGKKGWSDERFDEEVRIAPQRQADFALPNRKYFCDFAKRTGLALATHDDTTTDHVEQAHAEGACISEFPTSMVAAQRARSLNMATIAGAPNVVRGGSHSGNVAAADLARERVLDVLSSDYVPASLLNAAWQLTECADLSLPEAINIVSRNPARAVGLADRGVIRCGMRGDLVRVREVAGLPAVRDVWVLGSRVH